MTLTAGDYYCVMCGCTNNDTNGLERCRKSELDLSHLWARVGHVEDWFPVKRVRGPEGGIREPEGLAS